MSSKVYLIKNVEGLVLFDGDIESDIIINGIYLIIDPILRHITAIKYEYKPFWS